MEEAFSVHIAPHGKVVRARADRAVLDAALDAGLNLPHSCKSGHCGSCRARLLEGSIEYPQGIPLGITRDEVSDGQILLCQARARSDLRIEARLVARVDDVEIKTLPCRIARLVPLSLDVMQVFLRLPAVEPLRFQAGQYLDVLLEGGRRRSFSIASPPHDSALIELHVRHVPGGAFTGRLFSAPAEGTLLRIEGPVGQFVYREGTRPLILVAGGTGFAPLKSVLRHLLERGIERETHFYWGGRTAPDIYEAALVRAWTRRYPFLRFVPVLSAARAAGSASTAQGPAFREGWVHEAVLADHADLSRFDVYAAGPPAMIEAIRSRFPAHGLPAGQLYFDSFDYAPDSGPR